MLSMFKVTLYTFTCLLFAKSAVGEYNEELAHMFV